MDAQVHDYIQQGMDSVMRDMLRWISTRSNK